MSHVAFINESCHTVSSVTQWVMSDIWMSHVSHMNKSGPTYKWVMSYISMSHVAHMKHATHMKEQRWVFPEWFRNMFREHLGNTPCSLFPVPCSLKDCPPPKKNWLALASGGPAGRLASLDSDLFSVPCSLFPQDPTERTCVPCSLFP